MRQPRLRLRAAVAAREGLVGLAVRYDAAIIGAGSNGLAAAATLAQAGHRVVVLERAERCGGRCTTREFHPGFRASPFCDEIAPIPADIFRALDPARQGAIFLPSPASFALRPGRLCEQDRPFLHLKAEAGLRIAGYRTLAMEESSRSAKAGWFGSADADARWPPEDWATRSLADVLEECLGDDDCRAHFMAECLAGRAADPYLPGSALHLLAPRMGSGTTTGSLGVLASALERCARAAGAEISLGLEVSDIRCARRRIAGMRLADGTEIEARVVISTLDLRRTFSSLFEWKDLPEAATVRASTYRHAPAAARLLLALDAPPNLAGGPIFVSPAARSIAKAYAAWRAGMVPEHLPMMLRLVSANDPRLARSGKAVLTATLGCIPYRLFDGTWTNEKRLGLRESALSQIEAALPGTRACVLAAELIVPPDIEEALGITEGDLDCGEIAPDQMLARRGFAACPGARTPIAGLYLGGRSAPAGTLGTCAAGVAAARAAIADLAAGLLK